ncbi:acyltransferase family protein [Neokomagataea tanensis]|nr:acyltransferase [Neokomagataea tanensis]
MRGAAILAVLSNHIGIRIPLTHSNLTNILPRWFLTGLNYNGTEAVYVFFVLSGFLISSRMRDRYGSLDAVKPITFLVSRARRIIPPLLLLIIILLLLNALNIGDYRFDKAGQTATGACLAALGLYFNVWQARHGWSVASWTVLWSLSIEELFYLVFPFICRAGKYVFWPLLIGVAFVGLAAIAHNFQNDIWQDQNTYAGMGCIALGVVCSLLAPHLKYQTKIVVFFPIIALFLMVPDLFFGRFLWDRFGRCLVVCFVLGTALIVVFCALRGGRPSKSTYFLRRIGQLSYEIYLFHMFIVLSVLAVWRGTEAYSWVLYPVIVTCAWALGEAVFWSMRRLDNRLFSQLPR